MRQEFKVGDKVRVVKTIYTDVFSEYRVGDIFEVKKVGDEAIDTVGGPRLWYKEVEKVAKKSQRITDAELAIKAMQYEIAELKFEIATLKQAQKPAVKLADTAELFIDGKSIGKVNAVEARVLSLNEQRKVSIAEAKAFVEEYEVAAQGGAAIREGNGLLRKYVMNVKYEVNSEKRAVVSLLYRPRNGELVGKGITKCAPDDVFNADIGKAIALGRALGLDVSKFEHAVKPTEFAVGQIVDVACVTGGSYLVGKVTKVESQSSLYFEKCGEDDYCGVGIFNPKYDVGVPSKSTIVDDTDAKY